MKLNIGCGREIMDGWVNIDQFQEEGVDIVMDLDKKDVRLPFMDGSVEEILASHSLEHIFYYHRLMKEFGRVMRKGGRLTIRTPWGVSPQAHHLRFFDTSSLNAFIVGRGDRSSLEVEEIFKLISLKKSGLKDGWLINTLLRRNVMSSPELEWVLERV